MATVEIEIGENGEIGKLPDDVQKFFDKKYKEAYQKGADKSEAALKPHLVDPKELEDLRTIKKEYEAQRIALLERDKKYEEAKGEIERRHATDIETERKAHGKTKNKIRELTGKSIRAAAVEAGARSESLDELERLIGADVDFDDTLEPFIKDAEGKPLADKDGKPVTLEGYVKDYLDRKPHHKAGTHARGGKAPGGAHLKGSTTPQPGSREAARANLEENSSSVEAQRGLIAAIAGRA
jgi:hypothetical protein